MVDDVSLGEVHRAVLRMEQQHGERLSEIEKQTKLTNGNIQRHDVRLKNLEREVFDGQPPQPSSPPAAPAAPASDFALTLSPKMWGALAALVSALSMFAPVVAEWLKQWLLGGGTP